jgi:hypothetical protein
MPEPYLIYGVDNSFYTLKTVGAFRASGVPFRCLYKSLAVRADVEQASVYRLLPDTLKRLLHVVAADFRGFLAVCRVAAERGAEPASRAVKQMTAQKYAERCRQYRAARFALLPRADHDHMFTTTDILAIDQSRDSHA